MLEKEFLSKNYRIEKSLIIDVNDKQVSAYRVARELATVFSIASNDAYEYVSPWLSNHGYSFELLSWLKPEFEIEMTGLGRCFFLSANNLKFESKPPITVRTSMGLIPMRQSNETSFSFSTKMFDIPEDIYESQFSTFLTNPSKYDAIVSKIENGEVIMSLHGCLITSIKTENTYSLKNKGFDFIIDLSVDYMNAR